jgi:hypothetical protein
MKKGIIIKKGILIAISAIAAAGVGYFIYQKIADRNKEIIKEGSFTIKVDDSASTGVPSEQDFYSEEEEVKALDDSYYTELDDYNYYDSDIEEAPSWTYNDEE